MGRSSTRAAWNHQHAARDRNREIAGAIDARPALSCPFTTGYGIV